MFSLKISTANDAFGHTPEEVAAEVRRILKETGDNITKDPERLVSRHGDASGVLHDVNGNNVGSWRYRST
jgi:hypothetical protein